MSLVPQSSTNSRHGDNTGLHVFIENSKTELMGCANNGGKVCRVNDSGPYNKAESTEL